MRLSDYFIAITSRSAGNIYSGLRVSAIWRALSRSGSSIHTCKTTRNGTRSGIATTRSGRGERNCSSGNALPIPTGTTGMCVHRRVTNWLKRHFGKHLGPFFLSNTSPRRCSAWIYCWPGATRNATWVLRGDLLAGTSRWALRPSLF